MNYTLLDFSIIVVYQSLLLHVLVYYSVLYSVRFCSIMNCPKKLKGLAGTWLHWGT